MNRNIAHIGTVLLGLFALLFVNLNVLTLVRSDELANHPANRRVIIREYAIARGPIVVGEHAIAYSQPTSGELRYLRTYPEATRYAHLTGYYSVVLQRSGLEAAVNDDLTGRSTEVVAQNLSELLVGDDQAGNAVVLTIDPAVQQAAETALAGREGAIVAIEPTSGAVLASYANPTFDPNRVSGHDTEEIQRAWQQLHDADDQPLIDRTRQELYPPGSTFKIVVAAAALESGTTPDEEFPDERFFDVPQTTANIRNFGGGLCADGTTIRLDDAFRVSCNTVFARLGVDLGAETLAAQAERFGFNHTIPYVLDTVPSDFPDDLDVPSTAQSAIGQRDVRATPMQMAMIAAAIANDGILVVPHVVQTVRDPEGGRVRAAEVARWTGTPGDGRAVSARTAAQLRDLMVRVVQSGTGTRAQIDGVEVGGKTGTAQTGAGSIAWFVGFAERDIAVAVVIVDTDPADTGGSAAAPVARAVMEAARGR
ncbi:MAG: penicillin-binding protein 2 [Nitriliruptoraceae bacterium]